VVTFDKEGTAPRHDLPVLPTVTAAYRLLAREFGTIVRLSWATLLVVALVQYLIAQTVLADMAAELASGDVGAPAAIGRHPAWLALKMTADMVGTAIVAVAIHELILFGDRKSGQYFHIAFGKRETLFVLLALALGIVVVVFATVVISPFGEPTAGLAPFVATLAFFIAIYLSIRLWPILPIIVVEGRLDFTGAWVLTRRKFWSLLAVAVLGTIPIGIVALAIDSLWPSFDSLMDTITGLRESRPGLAVAATAVRRAQDWLLVRAFLDFVTSIVYTAIAVALVSYSYKALTGRAPEDVLTPKA